MSRSKKWMLYSLYVLVAISVYHDLAPDNRQPEPNLSDPLFEEFQGTERVYVVKRTIMPGDTLLSITEEIHEHTPSTFDIDHVIRDFKKANKDADPYQLQVSKTYYFPLYMHLR